MSEIVFFLSVGLAHAMTNIDNLAVMLVLAPAIGVRRCLSVYVGTQLICIAVSGIAGVTALSLLGAWVGYVGFIPIGLGLFAFWQQSQGDNSVPTAPPSSLMATIILFLGLGLDTMMIMSAILGDSSEVWQGLAYLGAAASIFALSVMFLLMINGRIANRVVERIGRFAPYAMIAVGLYILSNSFSDTI